MVGLITRFGVTFVAVFVASVVLPASMFKIESIAGAAVFAAVLALINALVRPIILLLTCPIQLMTLGLSIILINALLFLLAANASGLLGQGTVAVGGFVGALVASLVVSIVSTIVSLVVRT